MKAAVALLAMAAAAAVACARAPAPPPKDAGECLTIVVAGADAGPDASPPNPGF